MSRDRGEMVQLLKAEVVPLLRRNGYTGSFPHLRRVLPDRTELLSVRFDRHGGGFAVELAVVPPGDEVESYTGERIPRDKLDTSVVPHLERMRLGAGKPGEDHWFRYGGLRLMGRRRRMEALARQVREMLDARVAPASEPAE